jgi:ribokinase
VVLNAAPSRQLPPELLEAVDVLVVNENEAADLARQLSLLEPSTSLTPTEAARRLVGAISELVGDVVVTLGGDGVLAFDAETGESFSLPAPAVKVRDTTGAGDTFCGALAAGLAAGEPLSAAARFAVAAASLSVQSQGAVPAIPDRAAIVAVLAEQGQH